MPPPPKPPPAPALPVGVLLVDDHPLVRDRLAAVVNAEPELRVVGEAAERAEALAQALATRPALAIVDLNLRQSSGLELIKDLGAHLPDLRVLVVSMYEATHYAERCLRAGARGYITKQEATANILEAIRTVLAGGIYLNSDLARELAARTAVRGKAGPTELRDLLSARELMVFGLIGQGCSTQVIAGQLEIGAKTVETYQWRIRQKLGLKDSRALLQAAIRYDAEGRFAAFPP
jgi:DNA-binding NarL/FixJ family response regulator